MEFVVGDIVVIDKRTDFTISGATWVPDMDNYVGTGYEYEVVEVRRPGVMLRRCGDTRRQRSPYVWPMTSLRLI